MNLTQRHQLTALDRALVHLLDERARLAREGDAPAEAFVDDLLARSDGDFPGARLREVFAAVDAGCREARGQVVGEGESTR